jgi:copper chaperone CopZ
MKFFLLTATLLAALFAQAETVTYQLKGVHCGGCTSAIESKVCKIEGLTGCKVEVLDGKKKLGQMTLTTADGTPIDLAQVEKALSEAGEYSMIPAAKKK